MAFTDNLTIINSGTSGIVLSSAFDVSMRQIKNLLFYSTDIGTGQTGTLTVDVSNDAANWVAYNRLLSNVTNSVNQTDIKVGTAVITPAATTTIVFFPTSDYFKYIRVKTTAGTSGAFTVQLGAYSSTI